ncbi:NADP-dependent isocitrate dehydrogenase [Lacticaseibacillus baoqingensis]|uniref:Isocitrate dehydrogenase [NADP] n=1 Tax=Lacticaseibacillus baoqingensis TaxID=2486013 RepID=A0ABW4E3K9_9LACO|nr:NADP-dependent isocitrate dehydrogenase [Lacticaseibacillus baoqingensis]
MSQPITMQAGKLLTPDIPQIPYIQGDGIGPEIWAAARLVFDAAVKKAYAGKRQVDWLPLQAGEAAFADTGKWLPEETVATLKSHLVAIKGPFTTPVGEGHRSINVTLRQMLDLYACYRPVQYFAGTPAPVVHPEYVNIDVFRENTEDIYAGIEAAAGTQEANAWLALLASQNQLSKVRFPNSSAFSIKPVSSEGSRRLVHAAIAHALQHGRHHVTLVHKGNIMKQTEGGFKRWGYQEAQESFADQTFTMAEYNRIQKEEGKAAADQALTAAKHAHKVIVDDIICDNFFQQALLHAENFEVVATMNLNGDYISDALAAQVGGIGIAPGANINYDNGRAIFEATHGTAPQFAGQDKMNPTSLILSGAMLFDYVGWPEAADLIRSGIGNAIKSHHVTVDFATDAKATVLGTHGFGEYVAKNL